MNYQLWSLISILSKWYYFFQRQFLLQLIIFKSDIVLSPYYLSMKLMILLFFFVRSRHENNETELKNLMKIFDISESCFHTLDDWKKNKDFKVFHHSQIVHIILIFFLWKISIRWYSLHIPKFDMIEYRMKNSSSRTWCLMIIIYSLQIFVFLYFNQFL